MLKIRIGFIFLALSTIAQCQRKEKREFFNTIDLTNRLEDTRLLVGGKNYKQNPGQITTRIPTTIPFAKQIIYAYKPLTPPPVVPKRTYTYEPPGNNGYEYLEPITYLPPNKTQVTPPPNEQPLTYLPPTNVTPPPEKPPSTYLPPTIPTTKTPSSYLPPTKQPNTYLPPSTPGNRYLTPNFTRPSTIYSTLMPTFPNFPPAMNVTYTPFPTSYFTHPDLPTPSPISPFPNTTIKGYVYEEPELKFPDEEVKYFGKYPFRL